MSYVAYTFGDDVGAVTTECVDHHCYVSWDTSTTTCSAEFNIIRHATDEGFPEIDLPDATLQWEPGWIEFKQIVRDQCFPVVVKASDVLPTVPTVAQALRKTKQVSKRHFRRFTNGERVRHYEATCRRPAGKVVFTCNSQVRSRKTTGYYSTRIRMTDDGVRAKFTGIAYVR